MLRSQTTIQNLLLTMCAVLLLSSWSFSQSTTLCTAATNYSNFGVDGDLYANTPSSANGDDWFSSTLFPGTNIGIIGTSSTTAQPPMTATDFKDLLRLGISPVSRNRTYLQHMSVPNGTTVKGQLLYDAVAMRDYISAAGARDSSLFTGFGNKNGYNPTLWTLDINNIPQKNDLVDVGGHLRQDLTSGHLLGYTFATTLSASGDCHLDFEYYQTIPVFSVPTKKVSNTGPPWSGGHTATLFSSIGTVRKTGDFLICVDYETGGTNPKTTIRVWINPHNVDSLGNDTAYINTKVSRPYTFTGVFNGGTGTNGFGYAEIKPNPNAPCLVAAVMNKQSTPAGPWGSLSGPLARYSDTIDPMQLMETYIDFTALGVGIITNTSNICSVSFGALLIKTRTSHSFTSDLKDYAGPFEFKIQ